MPKAKDAEEELASFMAKFTPEIASHAKAIRAEMRELYPTALELVYDNYNALAIGYGPTERSSEAIFSIALFPRWVSLFFLHSATLPDPDKILCGSGKVAKHVVLTSTARLKDPAVQTLMREATARAKVAFDPKGVHRLIVKSISAKQRPRRPASNASSANPANSANPDDNGGSAKPAPGQP
jgi:hypothetical protein